MWLWSSRLRALVFLIEPAKQLCWKSSRNWVVSPGSLITNHLIDDGQQFAHAGGQGHLQRFSFGYQALIELFDNWIEPHGREGGHIEHAAHPGAATKDMSHPAVLATVVIEGCHPNELTD